MRAVQTQPTQISAVDLPRLVNDFIAQLDLSATTRRAYCSGLKKWLAYQNGSSGLPDTRAVVAYKRHLQNQNLSNYSTGLCLTALRMFLEYLAVNGMIAYNPAQAVRGVKRPKSRRASLTKDEADRLTALPFTHSRKDRRDKAIVWLRLFTGLRAVSIARADISDIKQKDQIRLLYYRGKGQDFKDSFVVLTPRVWQALEAYLKDAADQGPLFTAVNSYNRLSTRAVYDITCRALEKAMIIRNDIQPHSLRHTAITFSILGGADIAQAQQMAGHHDLETTAGYFHDIRRTADPAENHIETYLLGK